MKNWMIPIAVCMFFLGGWMCHHAVIAEASAPLHPWPTVVYIDIEKPAIYVNGEQRYIYLPRTWNKAAEGHLLRADQPVPAGRVLNQMRSTPWGPMFWHGVASSQSRGWLPYPLLTVRAPR